MLYLSASAIRSMQVWERNQYCGIKILAHQSHWQTLRNATQRGKTHHCLWPKTLTHLNLLTYVLDAIRTFMLAGRTSATRVSGLSLRELNLICRNAAQISNKS